MSLHDRIAELQCLEGYSSHVKHGFVMAQNEAAQIAKEADELMAEMVEVLESFESAIHDDCPAHAALVKYYAWKESTK